MYDHKNENLNTSTLYISIYLNYNLYYFQSLSMKMNRNFKPVKPQWPDSLILAINHAHAIYLANSFLEIRSFLKQCSQH